MRLGVLFSGGKDSTLALVKAMEKEDVVCLITLRSKNPESYMFHTPNISIAKLQAEAIGLPLIEKETLGEKEKELVELKEAISEARKKHKIDGVVTGAVESAYQSERVQKICDELGLWCFNPLWKADQEALLRETVSLGFKTMISGVFAYPLDKSWLGRIIDEKTISELVLMRDKHRISPTGEGGEIETTVLDAPFFRKKIEVIDSQIAWDKNSGVFVIKNARIVDR